MLEATLIAQGEDVFEEVEREKIGKEIKRKKEIEAAAAIKEEERKLQRERDVSENRWRKNDRRMKKKGKLGRERGVG